MIRVSAGELYIPEFTCRNGKVLVRGAQIELKKSAAEAAGIPSRLIGDRGAFSIDPTKYPELAAARDDFEGLLLRAVAFEAGLVEDAEQVVLDLSETPETAAVDYSDDAEPCPECGRVPHAADCPRRPRVRMV